MCNGLAAAGQLSFWSCSGSVSANKQRRLIVTLVFLSSLPKLAMVTSFSSRLAWFCPQWSFHGSGGSGGRGGRLPTLHELGYLAVVACATMAATICYSMTILWTTVIGTTYSTDVHTMGWQSTVVGGGVLLGRVLGGFALSYIPKVKYQTIIASYLAFTFVAYLSPISRGNHSVFIVLGVLGCTAIGFVDNITFPVTLVVELHDIGLFSGVLSSIRACGGATAQELYVPVLQNKIAVYLPEYATPAALSASLQSSSLSALFCGIATGNFSNAPSVNPEIIRAIGPEAMRTYISSFRIVFYVTIRFSALLILAACFVPNMEMLGYNVAKRL
jgi:hypothetical protein